MSLAMATTILRTVSDWAASPKLTLSSLVTPSTSMATSGPKSAFEVRQGVRGVLDGVVEQRSGQGGPAEPQFGEDRGHGHRVGDVGIAALALLPAVALLRHHEGALDEVEVLFGVVRPDGPQQRLEDGRIRGGAPAGQPRQPGPRALTPAREGGPDAGVVHRHARRRGARQPPDQSAVPGPDCCPRQPLAPTSNVLPMKHPSRPV